MKFIKNSIILSVCLLMSILSFKTCVGANTNISSGVSSGCVLKPVLSFDVDKENNETFKCCCFDSTNDTYEFSCHTKKDGQILLSLDIKINPNDLQKSLLNKSADERLIATIQREDPSGLPKILHQMPLVSISNKSKKVLTCSFAITPEQHAILKNIASNSDISCEDLTIGIYKYGVNFSDVLSHFKHLVGHFEIKPNDHVLNPSI